MARIGMYSNVNGRGLTNQDSCLAKVARTPVGEVAAVVVCDGVGGFDAGELASGSVVTRFARWFDEELADYVMVNSRQGTLDITGIKKEWATLLDNCNDALYRQSARDGKRLGSTFTGVFAHKGMYVVAQVGDTRCYLVTRDEVRQITSDQTIANLAVAQGSLTAEEAEQHPDRHVLVQAVGAQNGISPTITMGSYAPGSIFVVCSDGFYEPLQIDEIGTMFAPVVTAEDLVIEETCEMATRLGASRGELDDATVACVAMDAWSAVDALGAADDSEAMTSLFAAEADLRDDSENPTVYFPQDAAEVEDTRDTRSGTEASTAGHLMGFGRDFDDDDEATVDTFEEGDE